MKTIGITGGSSLFELGRAADVQLFFDCLDVYAAPHLPSIDRKILVDRFYKRYIRQDELKFSIRAMIEVRNLFAQIPARTIDWNRLEASSESTKFSPHCDTLAEVFERYFESFSYCVESAKLNLDAFKDCPGYHYEPVRLLVADQPWFMEEKNRPLSEYDDLVGKPFWLRN